MVGRSCIPLYGLLLSGTPGASSYMFPDPATYCGNYADEVGCCERHSGGLQCRDLSKCKARPGTNCSDADAARRIGMTCAGFPWWNGGWPLLLWLHWDFEREFYECDTTASPSSTSDYCSQWITVEDSEGEWEAGACKCTQERNDNELGRPYCAHWSCEQVEVNKCTASGARTVPKYESDGDGAWLQERFPGFRPSRRGDWDKYPYVCMCTKDSGTEYECGPEHVETEKTDCSCLEVTSQGVCKRWYCREYDDAGRHDVEHEYYHATAIDGSTGRVRGWVGDIDSRSEFEVAECECTLPSDNERFCVEWQCSERGLPYFYPNLFISLFHLLVCAAGTLIPFLCYTEEKELHGTDCCTLSCSSREDCADTASIIGAFCLCILVPVVGFTILCLWLGGVGELVIVLSVYLGVPSVWYGVYYVRAKRRASAEGSTSSQPASPRQAGALVVQRARSGVAARASDARSWRQSRRRDDTAASAAASVPAAALNAAQVEIMER